MNLSYFIKYIDKSLIGRKCFETTQLYTYMMKKRKTYNGWTSGAMSSRKGFLQKLKGDTISQWKSIVERNEEIVFYGTSVSQPKAQTWTSSIKTSVESQRFLDIYNISIRIFYFEILGTFWDYRINDFWTHWGFKHWMIWSCDTFRTSNHTAFIWLSAVTLGYNNKRITFEHIVIVHAFLHKAHDTHDIQNNPTVVKCTFQTKQKSIFATTSSFFLGGCQSQREIKIQNSWNSFLFLRKVIRFG